MLFLEALWKQTPEARLITQIMYSWKLPVWRCLFFAFFDGLLKKSWEHYEKKNNNTKKKRWEQWWLKAKIASINKATNDRQIIIRVHSSDTFASVAAKPFPGFFSSSV